MASAKNRVIPFMKPLLAANYDESKLVFPILAQPKIDGVRGLTIQSRLVGRSLKTHANEYVTKLFSQPQYNWLDGELTTYAINDPACCRKTTGDINRISGTPQIMWYVFDDIRPEMLDMPYLSRLSALKLRAQNLPFVTVIEAKLIHNLDELYAYDDEQLDKGMEGTILRRLDGLYKQGRSTARSAELLRIKRFIEEEAVVIEIEEGEINGNEATINELGRTERSTHKENMIPNGQVGTLICRDVKTGQTIRVAAGCMPHAERKRYWKRPQDLLGLTIKYKHFPKGVKDKPRFPTFQTIRAESDIDGS